MSKNIQMAIPATEGGNHWEDAYPKTTIENVEGLDNRLQIIEGEIDDLGADLPSWEWQTPAPGSKNAGAYIPAMVFSPSGNVQVMMPSKSSTESGVMLENHLAAMGIFPAPMPDVTNKAVTVGLIYEYTDADGKLYYKWISFRGTYTTKPITITQSTGGTVTIREANGITYVHYTLSTPTSNSLFEGFGVTTEIKTVRLAGFSVSFSG